MSALSASGVDVTGKQPSYQVFPDVPVSVVAKPQVFWKKTGGRVLMVYVLKMTPGTEILLHAPPTAEGFGPIPQFMGLDLSDYDFRNDVAYSCTAAPAGATVTLAVVTEV